MAGAETAGTYNAFECLTMEDVDTHLEGVFNYFDNNTTKLMIYIGRYMDQRPNFGANAVQSKQDGPLYSDFRFWRGGFTGRDFLNSVKSGSLGGDKDQDEEAKEKAIALKQAELCEMQMIRRRASVIGLQEKILKERAAAGRKTSNAQETSLIVSEALKLAKQEDEEEDAMGLVGLFGEDDEDAELPEEEKNWKYLPYNAMSGNEVDEALAEQLNIWEIDVNIRRLKNKRKGRKKGKASKMKDIYKVNDKKYIVRFIHGVLLARELNTGSKTSFQELIPLLRKVAGMPEAAGRKGPTVHGQ